MADRVALVVGDGDFPAAVGGVGGGGGELRARAGSRGPSSRFSPARSARRWRVASGTVTSGSGGRAAAAPLAGRRRCCRAGSSLVVVTARARRRRSVLGPPCRPGRRDRAVHHRRRWVRLRRPPSSAATGRRRRCGRPVRAWVAAGSRRRGRVWCWWRLRAGGRRRRWRPQRGPRRGGRDRPGPAGGWLWWRGNTPDASYSAAAGQHVGAAGQGLRRGQVAAGQAGRAGLLTEHRDAGLPFRLRAAAFGDVRARRRGRPARPAARPGGRFCPPARRRSAPRRGRPGLRSRGANLATSRALGRVRVPSASSRPMPGSRCRASRPGWRGSLPTPAPSPRRPRPHR